jgi:hypothetical protein
MASYLLPKRVVLESFKVRPFVLVSLFFFFVPLTLNGVKVALYGLILILPLKFLALYEVGAYTKGAPGHITSNALVDLSYPTGGSNAPSLISLNLNFLFPLIS